MSGSKKEISRWLLITAVFFIVISIICQPSFAASKDFEDLSGNGKSGKVNISVKTYQQKDGKIYKAPSLVKIKAGDKTSYIPVITNEGSKCELRLRVYAKTKTQNINILKYCYGWEDNWDFKKGWFYYKKTFEENESVEICQGFNFPDEWQWKVSNILGITIEAEAIADEPTQRIIKTGDDENILIWIAAALTSALIITAVWRKKNDSKDI